ncbi:MAG: ComEC/Rec2 family competence protein [Ruminococcaceae bacterium]|nr:ComEC/Rec2 family competence protein [Oscillospiraceae bacterium]
MKRIFCVLSFSFLVSSLFTLTVGYKYFYIVLASLAGLVALTLLVYIFTKSQKLLFLTVALIFALSAALLARFVHLPKMTLAEELDGKDYFTRGTITGISRTRNYTIVVARCTVDDDLYDGNVTVILKGNVADADIGKYIEFNGTLEYCNTFNDKGKESFLKAFPDSYVIGESNSYFWNFVFDTRLKIRETADTMPDSAMIKAFILGDKSALGTEVQEDFKRIGTSHLLAISGLHLTIIVMSLYQFLARLRLSLRTSAVLSSLVALFYLTVSGFSLSLLRAAEMLIVFFFARCIRRENDSITALFIAGFFLALISPWSLFNIGFILSFLATLGILVFASSAVDKYRKYLEEQKEKGKRFTRRQHFAHSLIADLLSAAMTSLAATAMTMPVIMATLNEISAFFLIGNLLIIPLAKYYLIFSCLTVSFKAFGVLLIAYPFGFVGEAFQNLFVWLSSVLAGFAGDGLSFDRTYMTCGIAVISVLAVMLFFFSRKVWALPAFVAAMFLFIPIFNSVSAKLIYPTALVDTANSKGVNTTLVRWRDEVYLLDQSPGKSKRMYGLDSIFADNDITYIDKAVFIFPERIKTERVEALLNRFDIGTLVFITPQYDFDIPESDVWYNTEIEIVYEEIYEVAEGIDAVVYEDVCTAFLLNNNGNTFLSYYSYSEDDFVADIIDADVLVLNGKVSHIPAKGETGTSFRIAEGS